MELVQGEIPEAMYENQTNEMIRDFENRLRSQGLDMDTYMRYMGMDVNALKGMYRTDAEKRVKLRLALLAETYKMDVDKVKAAIAADSLSEDVRVQKALDLVKASAVIK